MPEGSSLQTISDPPAFDNPLFEPPKFDEVTCISIVKHCDEVIEQYHHGELVQTIWCNKFFLYLLSFQMLPTLEPLEIQQSLNTSHDWMRKLNQPDGLLNKPNLALLELVGNWEMVTPPGNPPITLLSHLSNPVTKPVIPLLHCLTQIQTLTLKSLPSSDLVCHGDTYDAKWVKFNKPELPWLTEDESVEPLSPLLWKTRKQLLEWAKDPWAVLISIVNSAHHVSFPESEWLPILKGHAVNFDKIHTHKLSLSSSTKDSRRVAAGVDILIGEPEPTKHIHTANNWEDLWYLFHRALTLASLHQQTELHDYHSWIQARFSTYHEPAHGWVITFNGKIRMEVALSQDIVLNEFSKVAHLEVMYINDLRHRVLTDKMLPGIIRSGSHDGLTVQKVQAPCNRFNQGCCTSLPSKCKYKGLGHVSLGMCQKVSQASHSLEERRKDYIPITPALDLTNFQWACKYHQINYLWHHTSCIFLFATTPFATNDMTFSLVPWTIPWARSHVARSHCYNKVCSSISVHNSPVMGGSHTFSCMHSPVPRCLLTPAYGLHAYQSQPLTLLLSSLLHSSYRIYQIKFKSRPCLISLATVLDLSQQPYHLDHLHKCLCYGHYQLKALP